MVRMERGPAVAITAIGLPVAAMFVSAEWRMSWNGPT